MTRITAAIKPYELCDQHLIVEHREIIRIPNCIKSGKAKVENLTSQFKMGSGHVTFFYNKVDYLFERYKRLYIECKLRKFNVQDYSEAFENIPPELFNSWHPDSTVRPLLVERINTRLQCMKSIRYYGVDIDYPSIKLT